MIRALMNPRRLLAAILFFVLAASGHAQDAKKEKASLDKVLKDLPVIFWNASSRSLKKDFPRLKNPATLEEYIEDFSVKELLLARNAEKQATATFTLISKDEPDSPWKVGLKHVNGEWVFTRFVRVLSGEESEILNDKDGSLGGFLVEELKAAQKPKAP